MNSHHDNLKMESNFQHIRGKYKSSIIYILYNKKKDLLNYKSLLEK